jgi:hypothetical protein
VAGALGDEAWADICAAAGRTPVAEAEARAVLSKILFDDYPAFSYKRADVAAAIKRAKRMLKHLVAYEADYRVQFKPVDDAVRTDDLKIRIRPDLWCLEGLRRRPAALLLVANTLKHANEGRRNVQRALLYHWLCSVWLDHFHAPDLSYETGHRRPPSGPLIEFILMAMRQIIPEDALPARKTVGDNIDRETEERANLKRELALIRREQARRGGLVRKK